MKLYGDVRYAKVIEKPDKIMDGRQRVVVP